MENFRPSKDLLKRYLESSCTEEERRRVDQWYANLNQSADNSDTGPEEELYNRILRRISPENRQRWIFWRQAGIAAALLIGLVTAGWFLIYKSISGDSQIAEIVNPSTDSMTVFQNRSTQIHLYILPDHSTIHLLPGATIEHPEHFPTGRRTISFRGEGFFNVQPDRSAPFIIHSGDVRTEVIGTSFNLTSNPEEKTFDIRVATGKVAVSRNHAGENERIVLVKNQRAAITSQSNGFIVDSVMEHQSDKDLWAPMSLSFQDTPLREVVSHLQHAFGTQIELENPLLGNCTITVELNNHNLPDVLSMINLILGTTYELKEQVILIKGRQCGG